MAFLKNHKGWQAFFWGCLVKKSRKTAFPGVLEIHYRSLAHAYVIERSFAEQLVNQPWQGIAFDDMLANLKQRFFCGLSHLCLSERRPTDNIRRQGLDRFRRWCGGLKRIQKANEWIHRHMLLLIGLHGMVIGLMVLGVMGLMG